MKVQINATQMQQGDVISFYGSEFVLGEVKVVCAGTEDEVYFAKGVCTNPSAQMLNDPYFYVPSTGEYAWQFQGNALRTMTKIVPEETELSKLSLLELHDIAVEAAKKAEAEYMAEHNEPAYCGFAWVTLYVDGRNPATKAFVNAGHASKGWDKGYVVWNPAGGFTQSMDVKEQGARAYAKVMQEAGIKAYAGSRAD